MSTGETPPTSRFKRFWQGLKGDDPDSRIPRGAVVVVVIGVIACIAAPLLSRLGGADSEAAHLFWVQQQPLPDSKPVAVPGGTQKMQLVDGGIRTTGTNISGYSLFRVLTTLKIEKGAPISEGKILCSVHASSGTEIAQSSGGLRATYPRSSEAGIYGQEVPQTVLLDFSSHGHEFAVLEVADVGERFTTVHGVKLEWPEYEVGTEHLEYLLGEEPPEKDMELPFYTIWKTLKPPATHVSCKLTTKAGSATVHTAGKMAHVAPPIDEEAEEATQEAKEESEEGSAAEESTAPEEEE
jgi:hypothetical protein